MHLIILCLIASLTSLDYAVADGILRVNFRSLSQESNELGSYCYPGEYLCRIQAIYCVRFGNSEKNFKCNFPNIELKVNAYAYKGNNEYILQFDETQSGSDIYFVLQTNNSFNGTFEVYSKIKTYSLTFEKENYYNAYFRGQIKTTDNVKAGIIHGRQQLQQVNTTLHYQLICTSGYTGMYCNIECNNGTCLLSNGTNDLPPEITSPSDGSTITVNISSSSFVLVTCMVIGISVEYFWLDSNQQSVSNDKHLFIGLQTLYNLTETTPYHCNAFNNHGLVMVTIYIRVVGGNRSRTDILSDLRQGISNEVDLDETDLVYFNEYLIFATDLFNSLLENDFTTQLLESGQDESEFENNYFVSEEYYTELYDIALTYHNLVQRLADNYNLLQQQSVTTSLLNTAHDILKISNKPSMRGNQTKAYIQDINQSPSITAATVQAYNALELISLNFADALDNQYDTETHILSYESISVYARSWTGSALGTDLYIQIPEYNPQISEQIHIPTDLINLLSDSTDKFSVAATFVDSYDYDSFRESNGEESQVASRIVQVVLPTSYANASQSLFPKPIQINFNATPLNNTEYHFSCVFLNKTILEWSTNNVYIGNVTNTSMVTCFTKHLTSFAVLVTPYRINTNSTDYTVTRIISYALGSLSFICLTLSLILFIAAGKDFFKIESNLVYFNSCLAIYFAMTLYVFASQSFTFNIFLCKAVAFLLHYTWLALFSWMLCIGILILYSIFIGTLPKKRIYPFLFIIGWLLPIIIPIITLGVGFNSYIPVNPQYCFLHHSLVYAFIGPVFVIILLNFIIFCITLCKIFFALKKTNNLKSHEIRKKTIITGFTLTPILGLPWGVTIFGIFVHHPIISWVHAVLNGSLGILFFFVVVLQNDEVQALLCKCRSNKHKLSKNTFISSKSAIIMKNRPRARSTKPEDQSEISPSNSICKSPTSPVESEIYVNNTETNDTESL